MIRRIEARSKLEGYSISRLPKFTFLESLRIRGTFDFLGVNAYTTALVKHIDDLPIGNVSYANDLSVYPYLDPSWEDSGSEWLKVFFYR